MVKKYLAVVKATWQEYLAYRTNFLLQVIGSFVTQLVIIALWYSIFKDLNAETIGSYRLPEMITYLLGAGIINSFILYSSQGDEVNDDINRGYLSNFLTKPLNIPVYWLSRDLCRRLLTLILGIGEYLVILLIFSKYLVAPSSLGFLLLALTAILLGGILHFFLFYIFSIIAFWMDQTWGPRFVIRVIMIVATGSLIPLSFFPDVWQKIFNVLPFKFMVFIPLQIYLGKISFDNIFWELLTVIIWILVLFKISSWVWQAGLKRYSAYGN